MASTIIFSMRTTLLLFALLAVGCGPSSSRRQFGLPGSQSSLGTTLKQGEIWEPPDEGGGSRGSTWGAPATKGEREGAARITNGAPVVTLLDRTLMYTELDARLHPVLRIQETERHLVIDNRARTAILPSAAYDRDLTLHSFEVRTVLPNGTILVASPDEQWDQRRFPSNILYTDGRRRALFPSGVKPGAVVEISRAYEMDHVRHIPHVSLIGEFPTLRREVWAKAARGTTLSMALLPEGEPVSPGANGLLRVVRTEVPEAHVPDGAPPVERFLPIVATAMTGGPSGAGEDYFPTWESLALYYRALIAGNLSPSEEVRAIAHEIAKGAGREREARIAAVTSWVRTHLRYVAIEAGIFAVTPRPVPDILRNRYGDCKELSALTVTLLGLLGVDASIVLIDAGGARSLPRNVPGMQWFNHAIVGVPGKEGMRFIDPTFASGDTYSLAWAEQGVEGLAITERPAIVRTPIDAAESNRSHTKIAVVLGADGSAEVEIEQTLTGLEAAELRAHARFGHPGEGRGVRHAMMSSRFGAYSMVRIAEEGLDPAHPSTDGRTATTSRLHAGRFVISAGTRWLVYPELGATSTGSVSDGGAGGARSAPLDLGAPGVTEVEVTLSLPEGAAIEYLPDPVIVDQPFGRAEIRFTRAGSNQIHYLRRVEMRGGSASPGDAPAIMAFRNIVSAATSVPVVLLPPGVGERSRAPIDVPAPAPKRRFP